MSPFIVLIVVLLAALLVCFLLWRRESRAAGAPLSITGLAIPCWWWRWPASAI